jgi:NlpC/P60 family putative phage cell wall peptidase
MNSLDDLRARVSEEARTWIGTPFFPHTCKKGVGCDCVQLALGIFKAVGFAPADMEFPPYRLGTGEHSSSSQVADWLEHSNYVEPEPDGPQPGDILTFKIGRVEHHVGVMCGDSEFVHCFRGYGVVVADLRDPTWHTRLRTVWRPKV